MDENAIPQKGVSPIDSNAGDVGVVFGEPGEVSVPVLPQKTPEIPQKETEEPMIPQKNAPHIPQKSAFVSRAPREMTPSIPESEIAPIKSRAPIAIRVPGLERPMSPGNQELQVAKPIVSDLNMQGKRLQSGTSGETSDISTLRTYQQDVASAIKTSKTSLVQMVLQEQRTKSLKEMIESPKSRLNLPLILLSIFFFLLTSGVIYYTFFYQQTVTTLVELHAVPLIVTDTSREIPIDGVTPATLSKKVTSEFLGANLSLDNLEYIYFTHTVTTQTDKGKVETKTIVSSADFFQLINLDISTKLLRSLKPDFMIGIHSFNRNQPFIILKIDSYEGAFSGMLEWESTMGPALLRFFGQEQKADELARRSWSDLTVKNKDLRVLYNFDGTIALCYLFKDPTTIIITTNTDTLSKLSNQLDLAGEKKVQ